uniref:Uncharacterized protein n=1 Tax=Rhizophora mucronata TaxID=61149 RepID=A0A2P2NGV5_RHIMU
MMLTWLEIKRNVEIYMFKYLLSMLWFQAYRIFFCVHMTAQADCILYPSHSLSCLLESNRSYIL